MEYGDHAALCAGNGLCADVDAGEMVYGGRNGIVSIENIVTTDLRMRRFVGRYDVYRKSRTGDADMADLFPRTTVGGLSVRA